MTAYELADWIENGSPFGEYKTAKQASTMLRQQAKEIDGLKQHWSEPQTDLIVLLREEVTLMQKYLEKQNLREHFVAWRQNDCE
jgi:hypothetical protein